MIKESGKFSQVKDLLQSVKTFRLVFPSDVWDGKKAVQGGRFFYIYMNTKGCSC